MMQPLLTAYGEPARRAVAIRDQDSGWQLPLTRQKWTITAADLPPIQIPGEEVERREEGWRKLLQLY